MKRQIIILFSLLVISGLTHSFAQEESITQNPNELVLSDEELIIIFSGFIVSVIAIFLYLARHQILRRRSDYDVGDYESKKNMDYEKYHSDWTSDEFVGKKTISKDEEEFRKSVENSNLPDFYKILGVPRGSTQDEIKNQFRLLVKEWHPDRNPDPETKEKMSEINKAYEVLSDKDRRKNYDKFFDVS